MGRSDRRPSRLAAALRMLLPVAAAIGLLAWIAFRPGESVHPDGSRWALFLVRGMTPQAAARMPLNRLPLEDRPVLSDVDLLGYRWEDHLLSLRSREDVLARLPPVPTSGLPFVVQVDGERLFLGAFWTGFSSLSTDLPVIDILRDPLSLDAGYPWPQPRDPDPRNDPRIRAVLGALGLLTPDGTPPTEPASTPAEPTPADPTPAEPTPADPTPVPAGVTVRLETEDGLLKGVEAARDKAGFTGTGYITGFDRGSDSFRIDFDLAASGRYRLHIRYDAPDGDRACYLEMNGLPLGSIDLPRTDGFADMAVEDLMLERGRNSLLLLSGKGGYDLDAFRLDPVVPDPVVHRPSREPVNPKASGAARRLLGYLADQYGTAILSGQADIGQVAWIEETTGKKPALVAFDMMRYYPSRTERGDASNEVELAIGWWRDGGIVSFQWHWNAPSGLLDVPGKEWYRGFYTDATTFDLAAALADPDSAEYALLLRDIDAIAFQLQRLEDAGVPVLWRPLHEAGGGWFWWGAKGAEAGKALYRLLYDRLTHLHGLDNLLWVWSSPESIWYPGDDVVDILGFDSYPAGGDYGPVQDRYDALVRIVGDRKIVAMTENGPIPDPDLLSAFRADWSWFATWGTFVRDEAQNGADHVRHVYAHPRVVTLDELPDWSGD